MKPSDSNINMLPVGIHNYRGEELDINFNGFFATTDRLRRNGWTVRVQISDGFHGTMAVFHIKQGRISLSTNAVVAAKRHMLFAYDSGSSDSVGDLLEAILSKQKKVVSHENVHSMSQVV